MIGAQMRTSRGPDAQGPAQQWSRWGVLLGGSAGSVGGVVLGLGRVDSGQAVYRLALDGSLAQSGTVRHSGLLTGCSLQQCRHSGRWVRFPVSMERPRALITSMPKFHVGISSTFSRARPQFGLPALPPQLLENGYAECDITVSTTFVVDAAKLLTCF